MTPQGWGNLWGDLSRYYFIIVTVNTEFSNNGGTSWSGWFLFC